MHFSALAYLIVYIYSNIMQCMHTDQFIYIYHSVCCSLAMKDIFTCFCLEYADIGMESGYAQVRSGFGQYNM